MSQPLSWDIIARDRMSDVLEKLAKASEKLDRTLSKTGDDGQRMGHQLEEGEQGVRRITDGMEHASGRARTMGDRLGVVGHAAASFLGNMAANAATAFASSVAQGTRSVLMLGVQTAASNQVAAISFEVLLGNARRAGDFLAQLQKFAANTPFELPELKDAASRLLAVGVNARDVIPIMTRLGDAAAGMGTGAEGIGRAIYALQQVKLGGVVHAGDLMQLSDAGIPALDALAAHFHTTVAKVKDMVSANKVHADDLFAAIETGEGPGFKRLKGMMDKQSATLTGVWSTFKDNATQALGKAFEPAIPSLTRLVNWAGSNLPKVIDGVVSFGQRLRNIFADTGLGQAIDNLFKKFKPQFIAQAKAAFADFMGSITRNRAEIAGVLKILAETIGWLIVHSPIVLDSLAAMIEVGARAVDVAALMGQAFLAHFRLIVDGAAKAFGWIPGLGPKLKTAAADFDKWANGVNNALDRIKDKKVNVTVTITEKRRLAGGPGSGLYNQQVPYQARAAGGPVRPGVLLVGEDGPELWYTNTPGYVQPLRHAAGAGATPAAPATASTAVEAVARWVGSGDRLVDALMAQIQIRVKAMYGGNVQKALGT